MCVTERIILKYNATVLDQVYQKMELQGKKAVLYTSKSMRRDREASSQISRLRCELYRPHKSCHAVLCLRQALFFFSNPAKNMLKCGGPII